jgi:hypothetical protein
MLTQLMSEDVHDLPKSAPADPERDVVAAYSRDGSERTLIIVDVTGVDSWLAVPEETTVDLETWR